MSKKNQCCSNKIPNIEIPCCGEDIFKPPIHLIQIYKDKTVLILDNNENIIIKGKLIGNLREDDTIFIKLDNSDEMIELHLK